MSLATAVTAYNNCQTGIVCTNSTHFRMCVIFANGSISLWNQSTACPHNTICDQSRCVDLQPSGYNFQNSRRCSIHGFMCTNSHEYQLCRYDQYGNSYPWGQYYPCSPSTVCNETSAYHCHAPNQSMHVPTTTGNLTPPKKDECNSKNFVCVDSKSYLLCRDMGDGIFKPYNQQYRCPGSQICHKSFDKPCSVEKSGGSSVYSQNWKGFSILVFLQVLYYKCIKLY